MLQTAQRRDGGTGVAPRWGALTDSSLMARFTAISGPGAAGEVCFVALGDVTALAFTNSSSGGGDGVADVFGLAESESLAGGKSALSSVPLDTLRRQSLLARRASAADLGRGCGASG